MTIRGKLKLAHLAMAFLAVALVTSFFVLERELERDFQVIHEQSGRIHTALMMLRFTGVRAISSANRVVLLSDHHDEGDAPREPRRSGGFKPETLERTIQEIQTASAQLQINLAMYSGLVNTYFPDELDTLQAVEAVTGRLIATSANTIELARQEAKGSLVVENLEKLGILEDDFLNVLNNALMAERREVSEQLALIESNFERGESAALVGGGIVVVLVFVIGTMVSNAITRPVRNLTSAVDRIGHGEFDVQLETGKRDEIGQLAVAVGSMSRKLKTMTSNLEGEVTERKHAETEAREKEARLRLITDNMPGHFIYFDAGLHYRLVNKGVEDLYGLPRGEIIGKHSSEIQSEASYRMVLPHLERSLAGEQATFEQRRTNSDGSVHDYQTTHLPHFSNDGSVVGCYVISLDITERKRAEADLKQTTKAAELLRKIAVAANSADNPDDAIQVCLDEVCAFSGWPIGHAFLLSDDGSEAPISASLWHLDDPDRFAAFRRVTEGMAIRPGIGLPGNVVSEGTSFWLADVETAENAEARKNYKRAVIGTESGIKTGFAIPVLVGRQVAAVLEFFTCDDTERDAQLLSIAEQVGVLVGRVIERRRNKQTLLDSKQEAEVASRSKSEFIANMSHELRTPLNAINGFSELLAEEAFGPLGNEEYKKFSQAINDSGQHLLSLINDILDISKIEVGRIELSEETFDMAPVIESCITMVGERAADGGVEIVVDIAETSLPQLRADRMRIKQVVLNLLTNAVKFTEPGGQVTLKAWHNEDSGFVLQVIDTGIGIAAADIPKALTRFQQVEGGLDRKQEGTGLGLPLAKSMVEQHGGSLDLQSELGVGTTVTVRLPATRTIMKAA